MANNGEVVHFRPSDNAPELRVYVEAQTEADVQRLLKRGLRQAAHAKA
jgi:phosphomannomutase